jgi:nitrogen fixation NifU-like protein
MYSEKLLDHFEHPRNVGELPPPALTIEISNPICGDIMRLSASVQHGRLHDVRYRTRGCTASIAAGSALTELLRGRTLEEAGQLKRADVEEALGGLAAESKHAAVLAIDAAKAIVKQWQSSGAIHASPDSRRS